MYSLYICLSYLLPRSTNLSFRSHLSPLFSAILMPMSFTLSLCFWFYFYDSSSSIAAFRYQKNQYNVFEVNQTGYDNCTMEGAVGNWSSGKDFIPLNKAKRYYFICGTGGCFNGMKVSVLVHRLPTPPSAAAISAKDSSSESDGQSIFRQWPVVFQAVMVLISSICLGYGWIWQRAMWTDIATGVFILCKISSFILLFGIYWNS